MDAARRHLLRFAIVAVAAGSLGCGYSLAGRGSFLPAHIQSIRVPLFKNNTAVFDAERRITEAVVSELIGRGKYRVVTGNDPADAVLEGTINSITLAPASVNAQGLASRYALVLAAGIEFRDLKDNKVIWSNPALQFREEYDLSGTVTDPNAFFGQDVNAMDRIAAEFARTLVSAILEAF